MLSIIIPTHNELKNKMIQTSFPSLSKLQQQNPLNLEIIIVDSHSDDGTYELAKNLNLKTLMHDTNSRAKRLNFGIKEAKGNLILLHHPRSLVSEEGIRALLKLEISKEKFTWGAFIHEFDIKHPLLIFTSFYSNYIRGNLRNIFYLDHCIFADKELLEKINFVPEVDIFEDTLLSIELKKYSRATLLPYTSKTSAIRFTKNGILKQAILNQVMKFKYYFNFDHKTINQQYEKDLNLNSNYSNKKKENEQ